MSFTHLQVRSGYSFYKSTMTINKLVRRASELGVTNLALTDEAVLYGAISFYETCQKYNIKPMIGLVVPFEIDEGTTVSSVLLAKNKAGYEELLQVSTSLQLNEAWQDSFFTRNIICIVSVNYNQLTQYVIDEKFTLLNKIFNHVSSHFQENDFYIGIDGHTVENEEEFLQKSKHYAAVSTLQFTALQDVRFAEAKDKYSYDCLRAMGQNKKWQPNSQTKSDSVNHFSSKREMESWFNAWPELLEETNNIAAKCNVHLSLYEQKLPKYPVPTEESASSYLQHICKQNLPEKYPASNFQAAEKRLTYELNVIEQLDFSDYFLIVADFVQYAKNKKIMVGPGRGSAAGSIVAYLLGITNVDPLKYHLLFERFLNPERVSMPDIDIDFADNRREEIIEYISEKYGQEYVAQIATFGTYSARALLRELMKTMEIDIRDQDFILKYIVSQNHTNLSGVIEREQELQAYIQQSQKLRQLFIIALTLEGLPRHVSTHAAGVVISDRSLIRDVPLTRGSHRVHLTQYAMNELEAIGLLKFDVLGVRNLTLIERIVGTIEHETGKIINIEQLPEHDEKVFALLQSGKTNGIFQLESDGMKNVLMSLKPTTIDDIVAINALYRPGPMEHISTYVKRKHGKESVTYIHPNLEPILKPTYGVLVYQEQIMQIVHEFAGLSMGAADILRRAISKKDRQLIEEQKLAFCNGCIQQGYSKQIAEEIFSWIVQFANYGFNKSHSVAYSKISYYLSYLKTYYPTYFFAHLLNSVVNETNKLQQYVKEAKEFGIQILPPSINKSNAYYRAEANNVRMGFIAIKGIGYETAKEIITIRKEKPIQDLFDFCLRAPHIKRKTIETLILAGIFDLQYENRASLLASLDQALERAELFGEMNGQALLFNEGSMQANYVDIEDFTIIQKLTDEKELLNLYVSSHPIKQYRPNLERQGYIKIEQLLLLQNRATAKIVGIVQSLKKIRTKRGESMAFVTIADESDEIEAVVFPNVFREVSNWLKEDMIVDTQGNVGERDNKKQYIIRQLKQYEAIEEKKIQEIIYIRLTENSKVQSALSFLAKKAKEYPGQAVVIIYNEEEGKSYKLEDGYYFKVNDETIELLKSFFGTENVVVK